LLPRLCLASGGGQVCRGALRSQHRHPDDRGGCGKQPRATRGRRGQRHDEQPEVHHVAGHARREPGGGPRCCQDPDAGRKSAYLLGAERVIAIDRFPYRLRKAEQAGAQTLNYEQTSVLEALDDLTGGRGPDACIDAVGMEAHHRITPLHAYDRAKQAARLETERPHALREAILACRNGGTVSVIGVYGGLMDKFPIGALMNRSLTVRTGQCHVQRYMRPLLERIREGAIDPSFVISHRLRLDEAPRGYELFKNKLDDCNKIVLTP
jgi:threonine dehydrogenase-like Zn-dependent dehydrogenase